MGLLLKAENVCFQQGHKKIVNEVSLEIKQDDFITIIGTNGSGKSSLLRLLLDVYPLTEGNIWKKPNLKIGYIPQKLKIEKTIPLSIFDFVTLGQKIDMDKILEILSIVGLEGKLNYQVEYLSGGEFQRLMLARALAQKPDLLVLDEPAQNLDVNGQLQFYKLLEKFYKEKKIAILMVSHDLYFVMASSTKVICFHHHICCMGEPQTISINPEFIKIFGQDMSDMMAYYNHKHDHSHY